MRLHFLKPGAVNVYHIYGALRKHTHLERHLNFSKMEHSQPQSSLQEKAEM